jgi:hypothetical protein
MGAEHDGMGQNVAPTPELEQFGERQALAEQSEPARHDRGSGDEISPRPPCGSRRALLTHRLSSLGFGVEALTWQGRSVLIGRKKRAMSRIISSAEACRLAAPLERRALCEIERTTGLGEGRKPMLRMSTVKVIGIASVLSMIWAGNGAADDAAPRGRATSPVKMSCRDYANSHTGESGLTTPAFHISGYSIPAPTSKSSTEFCATIDISKLSVTKDVSSFYWVWAVTDNEKACEAAAATRNSTMKGWEQEHINDAINIVATETSKLRDSVKDKIPVCASKGAEAVANLKKVVDTALKQGLADTQSAWSAAVAKRDGSGGHTYKSDCLCAH